MIHYWTVQESAVLTTQLVLNLTKRENMSFFSQVWMLSLLNWHENNKTLQYKRSNHWAFQSGGMIIPKYIVIMGRDWALADNGFVGWLILKTGMLGGLMNTALHDYSDWIIWWHHCSAQRPKTTWDKPSTLSCCSNKERLTTGCNNLKSHGISGGPLRLSRLINRIYETTNIKVS